MCVRRSCHGMRMHALPPPALSPPFAAPDLYGCASYVSLHIALGDPMGYWLALRHPFQKNVAHEGVGAHLPGDGLGAQVFLKSGGF